MKTYNLYNKELLNGEFVAKVYAYYSKEWFGREMAKPHSHQWMEVMYVVNGKCTVEFEDEAIKMKKGAFIFIDAMIPHRLVLDQIKSCRMLNIEFGFEACQQPQLSVRNMIKTSKAVETFVKQRQSKLYIRDFDEIQPVLLNLVHELNEGESAYLIQLMVSQLIVIMSRQGEIKNHDVLCSDYYVKKAVKFINENYNTSIQVCDIAREVNIHPSYLYRIFKKYMDMTINEYLVSVRVKKSKMLLERTDIPIIDISYDVGFSSRQYFSYVFKKHTSVSPVSYRKSCNIRTELLE